MSILPKKRESQETDVHEKLRYSRYYEHDGALRAYANRAMILAFLCLPSTLLAVGFAVYVRLQPPTVVRVDPSGEATVVGRAKPEITVVHGQDSDPTEFEQRAFVRLFLERYLDFSAANVSRNWAEGLNMMTANLRRTAFAAMQKENTIGKIEDDQTTSEFQLRSLEAAKEIPSLTSRSESRRSTTCTTRTRPSTKWSANSTFAWSWRSGRNRIPAGS